MSALRRWRGIVLKRRESHTDLWLDFLTKEEVLKVKAKGILKSNAKLKGATELFDFAEWEIVEGKNLLLVGAKLLKRPAYLRRSLIKVLCLKALAEITLLLVRSDTEKVFWLWFHLLKVLREIPEGAMGGVFCGFVVRLAYLEGLLDPNTGTFEDIQLPKSVLTHLLKTPYSELAKHYSPSFFVNLIKKIDRWLRHTKKTRTVVEIFMQELQDLSEGQKSSKIDS